MADNDVRIKVSLDGAEAAEKGLRGIGDGASDADSKLGGMASKGLAGAGKALIGFATATVVAGGILAAGVLQQYSAYEQNVGGIETLFKDSSAKVQGYAADAYKTAGLSANEYMSTITSFSAALLQGLGGDTDKAAEVGNRAITDMADNANKFGSNIESIQIAYQGFAKQNYTMLDNLKLGFGGTASEMARLVNESGVLGDSVTVSAETVNSVSYDKIIEAIGVVQDRMGVTGTTALEASTTISGSVATMKSAWENLLTGLGTTDSDVSALASNVISSVEQVLTNVQPVIEAIGENILSLGPQLGGMGESLITAIASALPAIVNAGVSLVGGLLQGIVGALPTLVTSLIPALVGLVSTVVKILPDLIYAGAQAVVALATGIAAALPDLIPIVIQGILDTVQAIVDAAPMLLDAGLQLIAGLGEGIIASLPLIIEALPQIIDGIVGFIVTGIPALIEVGMKLLTSLIGALPEIITQILAALPDIIISIIDAVIGAIPLLINAGIELFIALVEALPDIIIAIVSAIPKIITSIQTAFLSNLPVIIQAGITLITALIGAMPLIIQTIVAAIPDIITGLVNGFIDSIPQLITVGRQLIEGLWNGISGAAGWLFDKIGGFVNDVMGNIGSFFGIASPSKRMRDEIGQFLPSGIGVGIEENEDLAIEPIQSLNKKIMKEATSGLTGLDISHSFGPNDWSQVTYPAPMAFASTPSSGMGQGFSTALREALSEMQFSPEVTARIEPADMDTMSSRVQSALINVRAADGRSAALASQQGAR